MSDPVADPDPLPPAWIAAARAAASELGLATDLAVLSDERWREICAAVERKIADREAPPGWRSALARQAGRADPDERAQDEADARLAAEGEVFAPDDDA